MLKDEQVAGWIGYFSFFRTWLSRSLALTSARVLFFHASLQTRHAREALPTKIADWSTDFCMDFRICRFNGSVSLNGPIQHCLQIFKTSPLNFLMNLNPRKFSTFGLFFKKPTNSFTLFITSHPLRSDSCRNSFAAFASSGNSVKKSQLLLLFKRDQLFTIFTHRCHWRHRDQLNSPIRQRYRSHHRGNLIRVAIYLQHSL